MSAIKTIFYNSLERHKLTNQNLFIQEEGIN